MDHLLEQRDQQPAVGHRADLVAALHQAAHDIELGKEKQRQLGLAPEPPRFTKKQEHLRWSYLKNLGDPDEMLRIVRDEVFPYIKTLGGEGAESTYAQHMKDAVLMIMSAALLENVVGQIDGLPLAERDTMGDLYEYMLSKLTMDPGLLWEPPFSDIPRERARLRPSLPPPVPLR